MLPLSLGWFLRRWQACTHSLEAKISEPFASPAGPCIHFAVHCSPLHNIRKKPLHIEAEDRQLDAQAPSNGEGTAVAVAAPSRNVLLSMDEDEQSPEVRQCVSALREGKRSAPL